MKRIIVGGIVAIAALTLISCGGGDGGGGTDTGTALPGKATCTPTAGQGVVCGTVFATDGVTPLAGAEVRLSSGTANLATKGVEDATKCVADAAGDFACEVPAGQTGTLGFFIIFTGFDNKTFTADIVSDQVTNVGSQTMTASAAAKWVVVPGSFDGVQVLLAQLKGCTLNDIGGSPFDPATMDAAGARASEDCTNKGLLVLDDLNTGSDTYIPTFLTGSSLSTYDSLFVNCDADWSFEPNVDTSIQAFSNAGGHLYFSDLSDSWLSSAFPGAITFGGNNTSTGNVSGDVVHAGLAAVVGDPINIVFDLPVWTVIDSVQSFVTTYIQGDVTAVSSTVTGVRPITVGWRPSSSSGCIFYTSYHIEGASTGAAQELAIKYLVQNVGTVCQ